MSIDNKHIAIIRFLKNELSSLLNGDKKNTLVKEIDQFKDILIIKQDEDICSEINEFYDSIKNRRAIESLLTFIKANLTADEYTNFISKFARYSLNLNEPKLAIDLCYKIISPNFGKSKKLKVRAEAYLILSDSFLNQAYWEESLSYLKLAEIIFKSNNDDLGIFECYNRAGIIEAEQGNLKKASKNFEKALNLSKPKKHEDQKQKIKLNLGIIYAMLDKTNKAQKYLSKSLDYFIENKDRLNVSLALHNLGMFNLRNGNLEESQKSFNRSLSISSRNKFLMSKCITLVGKSQLALSKNSIDAANRFALQGFNLAIKINDRLSQAEFYKIYGIIYRIKKDYKLAESNLLTSLRINKETNNQLNYSETAIELGNLYGELNDSSKATFYYDLAKVFYKKNDIKRELKYISDALKAG